MKPNPPIPGHGLINRGNNGQRAGGFLSGGCWCGAHPGHLVGSTEMRRWHRDHKAALRAAAGAPEEEP